MSKKNTQIKEQNPENSSEGISNCPVCGYYVGSGATCVRCGSRIEKRISINLIKKLAIICSIVGLILLWVAAYMKKPPRVNIGNITETMNNALVEIEGEVREVEYQEDRNSFSMTIDDGTGQINARAVNDLDNFRRYHGDDMPDLRDVVNVIGTLNVSQTWGVSMFLSIPDRMRLVENYEIKEQPIISITPADKGEIYWVEADVEYYSKDSPREGLILHRIAFNDGSGSIEMVLFDGQFKALPDKIKQAITQEGAPFRMKVRAGEFRGDPQIDLVDPSGRPENIQLLDETAVTIVEKVDVDSLDEIPSSEISLLDEGKKYIVLADVKRVSLGIEGAYLELSDSEFPMFVSYDQREQIEDFSDLDSGQEKIKAPVKVTEVDGDIQLNLLEASEFNIQ